MHVPYGYSVNDIKGANARGNYHFFSPGAMRAFNSRVLSGVYEGPGGVYFVTSELLLTSRGRRYSVRQFHPANSRVSTVADFWQVTKPQAVARAKYLAKTVQAL